MHCHVDHLHGFVDRLVADLGQFPAPEAFGLLKSTEYSFPARTQQGLLPSGTVKHEIGDAPGRLADAEEALIGDQRFGLFPIKLCNRLPFIADLFKETLKRFVIFLKACFGNAELQFERDVGVAEGLRASLRVVLLSRWETV